MGASGAIIMGFFGALFAAMTLSLQLHGTGVLLALPFLAFVAVAAAAAHTLRLPGEGVVRTERAVRIIRWSSIAEGIGIFLAANIAINLGHRDLLLPAIALVVGLHFLPMAWGIPYRPFLVLGIVLLLAAVAGFAAPQPLGGEVAGFAAALALTAAAILAIRRDRAAKVAA
jgi:hypothetical protein